MKSWTITLLLFFSVGSCAPIGSYAQSPLEIAFEGPWIIYVEPQFSTGGATPAPVLIAMAPQVVGHYPMVFSSGDGISVPSGMYCVTIDQTCHPSANTILRSTSIPPELLPVKTPGRYFPPGGYVLILPIPDSYSADGKYTMSFQDAFPGTSKPHSIVEKHAIGMILHFNQASANVGLITCSGSLPSPKCPSAAANLQENSGTLRISIKAKDDTDPCDYHVRRAYHKMITLLDPMGTANTQLRYIYEPKYDSCTPCDPQQDLVPSDCTGMSPSTAGYKGRLDNAQLHGDLDRLVKLLKSIEVTPPKERPFFTNELSEWLGRLGPREFLRLSQLQGLTALLSESKANIGSFLAEDKKRAGNLLLPSDVRAQLERTIPLEESLADRTGQMQALIIDGKNCRVVEMQTQ